MGRIKRQQVRGGSASEKASPPIEYFDVDSDPAASEQGSVSPGKARNAARRRRKKTKSSLESLGLGLLRYGVDVSVKILSLLKWPLALFLTVALGRFLLVRSMGRIAGALQSQVRSGVCAIPFAGPFVESALPGFCQYSKVKLDFADIMELQRGTMDAAAAPVYSYSGSLPLQLKKAEMATGDLRTVLQASELSCKDSLDTALQSFSTHARDSSRAIQRTVVRVRGMVDAQLSMNEWAVGALQRIEDKSSSVLGGLVPFLGRFDTRQSVTATYLGAMDALSDHVRRLIEANDLAYESLDHLEEDLHLVHEILGLEKQFQQTGQEEVLSSLWSLVGGNRKAKKLFAENLRVLGDFENQRLANKEMIATTSVAFSKMMYQIEYMREQIRRPGLANDDDDNIPIEVHIRNIELAIESLRSTKDQGAAALGKKDSLDADDYLLT